HAWPNLRLIELGDVALTRHGELIAALSAVYLCNCNATQSCNSTSSSVVGSERLTMRCTASEKKTTAEAKECYPRPALGEPCNCGRRAKAERSCGRAGGGGEKHVFGMARRRTSDRSTSTRANKPPACTLPNEAKGKRRISMRKPTFNCCLKHRRI